MPPPLSTKLATIGGNDRPQPTGHVLTDEEEARRLSQFFNLTPYYAQQRAAFAEVHAMQTLLRESGLESKFADRDLRTRTACVCSCLDASCGL